MGLALALLLICTTAPGGQAREDHSGSLTFEACGAAGHLGAWRNGVGGDQGRVDPAGATTLALDSTVTHSGRFAGRIERDATSPGSFSSCVIAFDADFPGDTLELRGWLKVEGVAGSAGLWQRQDGRGQSYAFDNMSGRGLSGTRDWTECRVALPLDPRTRRVNIGVLLSGTGRVWLDDLRVSVDGHPLAEAPTRVLEQNVLDTDTTYRAGSGLTLTRLSPIQLEHVALLGRVWGFLKYHHPAVVRGERHWDFDLFRVLPGVLAAKDRGQAQRVLAAWVDSLGKVPACAPCAASPAGRPLVPRLGWLSDRAMLGDRLGATLRHIHVNRPADRKQFFVQFHPGVGNPDFSIESGHYGANASSDPGYRLLALFRFWNIIEYWSPYRDLVEEDWNAVLRESIPRVLAAPTTDDYALVMMQVIARVHDTHANLWSSLGLRPPKGEAQVPVLLRFVEGKAVVTGFADSVLGPASGLQVGDAILTLDGTPVDSLVARWRPYYAASNEPTRLRDMARSLTRGPAGPVGLGIERAGRPLEVPAERVPTNPQSARAGFTHDHPGETFRRLSADVAYLKLSSVRSRDAADYVKGASGAKLLVIDIRNYPSEFMVFALGQHLVERATEFARFTTADPANPGSFDWTPPLKLEPAAPRFLGRVAVLVDEVSQSQSEYTTMAFRSAPGAIVVGSTTAGADGNISPIALPGPLRTMISGIGVYYPDQRPTQRIGILPDVEALPTIAGIRAGRDEVLEAAVRAVLKREVTPAEYAALGVVTRP